MSQLVLRHSIGVIDLVSEDEERRLLEVLHSQKGVKLGFRFGKAFVVFGVNKEDNATDFWEIIPP
jgi:hypothetical protein